MSLSFEDRARLTGVILAGGRATRMGGRDKGLIRAAGKTLVQRVLEALRPQVGELLINANRHLEDYGRYGCRVVADRVAGYPGPLAGMASAMQAARTPLLLTAPCDSPLLPPDLAERLFAAKAEHRAEIAVAHSGQRLEPVFALLDTSLLASLRSFLGAGERKIDRWYGRHRTVAVDFSDRPETFLNLNTPEDLVLLETKLATIAP